VGLLRRTATLSSVEGEKPGKAMPDETPGLPHPLAASRPGLPNTLVAVAHLGSLGCVYAGLPVGMQETVRKLPDEAILLLVTLVSY